MTLAFERRKPYFDTVQLMGQVRSNVRSQDYAFRVSIFHENIETTWSFPLDKISETERPKIVEGARFRSECIVQAVGQMATIVDVCNIDIFDTEGVQELPIDPY